MTIYTTLVGLYGAYQFVSNPVINGPKDETETMAASFFKLCNGVIGFRLGQMVAEIALSAFESLFGLKLSSTPSQLLFTAVSFGILFSWPGIKEFFNPLRSNS